MKGHSRELYKQDIDKERQKVFLHKKTNKAYETNNIGTVRMAHRQRKKKESTERQNKPKFISKVSEKIQNNIGNLKRAQNQGEGTD